MLFRTLVLPVLLYKAVKCGRWQRERKRKRSLASSRPRIFPIRWQQHVLNKEELEVVVADPINKEVRRKRWCSGLDMPWEKNIDCAVALGWKSEGKRSRRRTKTTWPHTVKERDRLGWNTSMDKAGSKKLPALEGRSLGLSLHSSWLENNELNLTIRKLLAVRFWIVKSPVWLFCAPSRLSRKGLLAI